MPVFHNSRQSPQIPGLILDRLKHLLGLENDKDLAEELGVKANTLSTWRTRDTMDYERVFALCARKGFSLNYVIFKHGSRLLNSVDDIGEQVKLDEISFERLSQLMDTNANDHAALVALFKLKLHKGESPSGQLSERDEIIKQALAEMAEATGTHGPYNVNDEPPG